MGARILPPLRLLTVFETVLRAGNVKAAARDLNVSQPAISQALKTLEDHVGVPLLDRKTRPSSLTEAGRVLQLGVSEGLDRIADAILHIRSLQAASDNSVTIACSVGTATYWLMPRLAQFHIDHPSIAVNVMTTSGAPGFLPGVDLVIRYGSGRWRDGVSVKLFDERVVPVCSPDLRQQVEDGGGLSNATLLHVMSDDTTWLAWKDFFELNGLADNKGPGRHFTNYVQTTQAALSGQGVMLGWESNTGDLVREGRLVALNYTPLLPSDAFYIVIPPTSGSNQASRILAEWIKTLTTDLGV